MNAPKTPASGSHWQRVRHRLTGSTLRRDLLRGGIGSLAVKTTNAVLAFAVAVILARVLGPEGYGIYAFALAILMIVALPVEVGMPQLVVRETAKAHASEDWALMRGLWRWASVTVMVLAGMALAVTVLFLITQRDSMTPRIETLAVGALLIPVIALGNLRAASLRGLRRVVLGQLPESVIRPLVLLCLLFLGLGLGADDAIARPQVVMAFYVAAALTAFVVGAIMLRRARPEGVKQTTCRRTEPLYWRRAVLPLAMITGLQLVNNQADIIVLGIFRSDAEVGIYRAVFQTALLVVFGLQAMNQMLQPHFARLYRQGDMDRLQRLVTVSARVILALALPPVFVFVVFGGEVLGWVFGDAYRAGAVALAILAVGQGVKAAMGTSLSLLNMTGHERITANLGGAAVLVNIVLNLALVPLYGGVGAAVATATASSVWFIAMAHLTRATMNISIVPLSFAARRSS